MPIPDALDLVVETASLLSIVTAQQFVRIEAMRQEALTEPARHGYAITDVAERAARLELAAALAITESAAGTMIARADALVNRYPAALDSLAGARIGPAHAAVLVDALDAVEPELLDDLVPRAVALAETHAVGTFRRYLRTMVETVRSADIAERFEEAVGRSKVSRRSRAARPGVPNGRRRITATVLRDAGARDRNSPRLRSVVVWCARRYVFE